MRIWSVVLAGVCVLGTAGSSVAQDTPAVPPTSVTNPAAQSPTATPEPAAQVQVAAPASEPAAQTPAPATEPAAQAPVQTDATPATSAVQQAAPAADAPAAPAEQQAAPVADAPAAATVVQAAPVAAAPAVQATTPTTTVGPAVVPTGAKPAVEKPKSKKVEYTGPTTVIVLAPTPMLDEEGKQRMDPDGKLMFNPPVSQQRDKKGHPMFDADGKPIFQTKTELGYDEHGHKLQVKKEKPPKMTPVIISRGTFTVDGMIGKAELNYDIADLKFIYLYAPTIGTVVVSNNPFPGATEEKGAFNDTTLTVTTGEHTLQVASDKRLLSKKAESAFVLLDRDFRLPSKYPVVGYGVGLKAPYTWPGGRPNPTLVTNADIKPPPVPVNLRPVMLLQPCPAGQMRKAAPPVLPGQVAPEQPCVPIPKGAAVQSTAAKSTPAPVTPAPVAATPQN